MQKSIKDGGRLVLSAPMRSGVHQAPFHYFGGFSPFWYRHFLPLVGFHIIDVRPVCGLFLASAEEALRVAWYLSPVGPVPSGGTIWFRIATFPLWLLLTPLVVAAFPVCHALDRWWPITDFAAGFHVKATRRSADPAR